MRVCEKKNASFNDTTRYNFYIYIAPAYSWLSNSITEPITSAKVGKATGKPN